VCVSIIINAFKLQRVMFFFRFFFVFFFLYIRKVGALIVYRILHQLCICFFFYLFLFFFNIFLFNIVCVNIHYLPMVEHGVVATLLDLDLRFHLLIACSL